MRVGAWLSVVLLVPSIAYAQDWEDPPSDDPGSVSTGLPAGTVFQVLGGLLMPTSEEDADEVFGTSLALAGGAGYQSSRGLGVLIELGYSPLNIDDTLEDLADQAGGDVSGSLFWIAPQFTATFASGALRPSFTFGVGYHRVASSISAMGDEVSVVVDGLGFNGGIGFEGAASPLIGFIRFQRVSGTGTLEYNGVTEEADAAFSAIWFGIGLKTVTGN